MTEPSTSSYTYGGSPTLDLDSQLDRALERMNGDPAAAARLFLRWAESDSEIKSLIPNVIEDYLKKRMAKRAKVAAK